LFGLRGPPTKNGSSGKKISWVERTKRGSMDDGTKKALSALPLLTINAGPRDGDKWKDRLKEEYTALIKYIQLGKENDTDWFQIESNKEGTVWTGKVWYVYEMKKYEFDLKFDIPVSYPTTSPELALPELDGKTSKMYRGGKICLTVHFNPLWQRNVPKFGIAHAMALGMGPWLAAEVPDLVAKGLIQPAVDSK
ncbi:ubiquitin-fold modifier-conjugating enzyme 1, partial [Baffinella frigidus]